MSGIGTETERSSLKNLALRTLKASAGLFVFSFGSYLCIPANVGLSPWTAFSAGAAHASGLSFGTVSIITSAVILVADWLLKEQLGIATVLDALLVGIFIDFFLYLDLIPQINSFPAGIALLLAGQVFISAGSYFYMSPALGCGPRDSLMIAISKRAEKLPIGFIRGLIEGTALLIGWMLGAKVGIGTVISVFGIGFLLQITFKIFRFDANAVRHQNFSQSLKEAFPNLRG